jgi:peroxiredoxin Q/BCP
MSIQLGHEVPNFSAQSSDGLFQLSDYKGKYLVLYFYPKDNTPGCTRETCDFRDYQAEFAALNAVIVGVSRDSLQSHAKFIKGQTIPFPLIADTDSKICDLFKVIKEKSMFGKTALGLIRSTFLIDPNGVLVREWRKVSVDGHIDEVLAAIRANS